MSSDDRPGHSVGGQGSGGSLDVERDSDVPISTQIFWQITYQIDSGRMLPGARLAPVRELGAALRVNPNTIRAVYRRLADAGYVTSRHGAGTHVADRPPQRRGTEALAGIVAEMTRRAAHAGFTADELAAATFAAAAERKHPGPLVRVLFAECTSADAGYDAERLVDAFPGLIEAEGVAARRSARPARAVPLRPGRDDHVPRRRGPGPGRRPDPGRGDARRPRLPRARPRDRRAAQWLAGRPRVRVGARIRQHPRDAGAGRHPRRRHRLRAHRRHR